MKTFLWLTACAFAVVCFAGWIFLGLEIRSLQVALPGEGLPFLTLVFVRCRDAILLLPLPWVIAAVALSLRHQLSITAVLLFAGSLALVAAVFVSAYTIAAVLPFLPMKCC